MKIILSSFCICIFSLNCYSQISKNVKRDFSVFPVTEQLKVKDFLKAEQFSYEGIDLYRDSILVLVNSKSNSQKHYFNFYNINTKQFLPGMLEGGRNEGHTTGFISYGLEKDYLWVLDANREKIISLKTDSLHNSKVQRFIKEPYIPWVYYAAQLINDTTALVNGDYDGANDYKLAVFNLKTGKPTGYIVPYSADPAKPFKPEEKMAYESFLFIRPLKDKAVNASRFADRVEIVDLKTQQVKVVRGPEGFEPEFELMIRDDGKRIGVRTERNRFGFVAGKVTNQFIYLLYSGNLENTTHRWYGSTIYVYDWNGNPVKKLTLKNDIARFTVTANDDKIYTYNPITKLISVANLK